MATLILSTVGGIVGGPIGSAIGAVIGNALDRDVLFKPKGRDGPRLSANCTCRRRAMARRCNASSGRCAWVVA